MDSILLVLVKFISWLLCTLPYRLAVELAAQFLFLVAFLRPRYRRIALRNIEIAFPAKEALWRKNVLRQSVYALSRLLVDFSRMHKLDSAWVKEHVEYPFLERYFAIRRASPQTGILYITGHLGSFELLAHSMATAGPAFSFVVRNFQLPKLDAWWTSKREANGNRCIPRKGAYKGVVRTLRSGRDAAILFDQNVTVNNAVFVEWFGKMAATTKAAAMAALQTRAPVVFASLQYLGRDQYRSHFVECAVDDVYDNTDLDAEQKVRELTRRFVEGYEKMIIASPGEWFWVHKRWRTRPPGDEEDPYAGC